MDVICGRIYRDGLTEACIGIEDGRIVEIKKDLHGRKKDYGDAIIFPAAIDIHVHFREPGFEYKEDFFTGSKAAALSGVTCVLDMPNNKPAILTKNDFEAKVRKIKDKACIDYGLYAGIREKAEKMDCIAYKTFLSKDNEIFCSPDKLEEILKEVKQTGKPLAVHAEMEECIEHEKAEDLRKHERNRRIECELEALKKIVSINEKIGVKLHICHITTANSVDLLKEKASFGVTPHHLLFSYESKFKNEAMGKVNPPLRSEEERKKLFKKFVNGEISILESDHAPHLLQEKENFATAPSGMPGVDALFPIMLYMVKEGKINTDLLYKMACENPAKFFGINKGSIEVGRDADFIVIDFKDVGKIKALSKCGWSSYEGMPCIYPKHVYLRGEKIVEDGEFIGEKGIGKMIK
ncbi:MAG: dihydroorotase [Thermoplasmata archaeon]|nr:MAG: dihydroorotase [Thermoplasmata archaeon]